MSSNVLTAQRPEAAESGKTVDYRFKILYAVGMIAVLSGHGAGAVSLFFDWFSPYGFHMGLFAFVSGYFYKSRNEQHIGKYIIKKVRTLLVPLYAWNLFYAVLTVILANKGFRYLSAEVTWQQLVIMPMTNGNQFALNQAGWYVAPLFMAEVVNVLFRKFLSFLRGTAKELVCFVVYLTAGCVGVALAINGYFYGWWLVLVRMLCVLAFYAMGTLYKNVLEQYDRLPNVWYFALVMAAQLVLILVCGRMPTYTLMWCQDFVDGPVMPFVAGALGIAFWLRIARILEPVLGRSKGVNLIADNTFAIMVNHFLGFMLVNVGYILLNRWVALPNFDPEAIYWTMWYFYCPNGSSQFIILYLAAGLTVPILMQMVVDRIWAAARSIVKGIREK